MNLLFLTSNFNFYNTEQRLLQKIGYFNTHNYIKELSYLGFEYSFLYPLTLTIQSTQSYFFTLPLLRINEYIKYSYTSKEYSLICPNIKESKSHENYSTYNKLSSIYSSLYPFFNSLHILIHTGAKAKLSQLYQLMGIRGYLSGIGSNTFNLPILNNFSKGLNIFEYFTSCLGARKGIVDTAVKTADSGYLTKRLIGATQELIVKEHCCGTKNFYYYTQYITSLGDLSLPHKLLLHGKLLKMNIIDLHTREIISYKHTYVNSNIITFLWGKRYNLFKLNLTSVRLCSMERTICSVCLGSSTLSNNSLSKYIGVYVGQTVGEPSTQLTLRTFHTGGVHTINTSEKKYDEKLDLSFLTTQKYKICSFLKYCNLSIFNPRHNLSNIKRSDYIYSNKYNYIKQIKYNWIYFLNNIHLFNFSWRNRFHSIFQKNIQIKKNYNIFSFFLSYTDKSINILIKNKYNSWVYLNLNKPTVLSNCRYFQLQVKKHVISIHTSINNRYSSLNIVKYKKYLYSSYNSKTNLYLFYFQINLINILTWVNKTAKLRLFSNNFYLLDSKKYYN